MKHEPVDTDPGLLRHILVAVGLILAVLIVVAAAIYAGAFIMLAPILQ